MSSLFILLLLIGKCKCETSTSFGLSVDDASFATKNADGELALMDDGVYKRGEKIYFVLLHVAQFEEGEDGLNHFDMDIEFTNPQGEIILSERGVLGERGHVNLQNNIASSPYAVVQTTPDMEPGTYTIKVIIYDKVGNGSASKGSTLTLE